MCEVRREQLRLLWSRVTRREFCNWWLHGLPIRPSTAPMLFFFFLNETRCPITNNFIDNLAYIEKRLLFGVYTFVKFI
jgi:hypothetical protein